MYDKVIIIGGGFAGVEAAKTLKKLMKAGEVDLTVIEKNDSQTFRTEIQGVACGRLTPDAVKIPIENVLTPSIEVVHDFVEKIDPDEKKLYTKHERYYYDYLLVACGSDPAYFNIRGMKENSIALWHLEDALKIRDHVKKMFENAMNAAPEERKKMLTFVVGGGGFTGIEMMGELMNIVDEFCKAYGVDRKDVRLFIVEGLPRILPPIKDDEAVRKGVDYMREHGVEFKTSSFITSVTPDEIELKSGEIVKTKTVIWTGGVKGNDSIASFGVETDKRGRAIVNGYMETSLPGVYAMGDAASYVDENGDPMPGIVESAEQSAKTAAYNVIASIRGSEKKKLKLNLHGNIVSIGGKYGIADVKGLRVFQGRLAMWAKKFVYVLYFLKTGGIPMAFRYWKKLRS